MGGGKGIVPSTDRRVGNGIDDVTADMAQDQRQHSTDDLSCGGTVV